jgi:poly(3-hydroxybutyrate) depolymerase
MSERPGGGAFMSERPGGGAFTSERPGGWRQSQAYWTYSVPEAARLWAAYDGCQAASPRIVSGRGYSLTSYSGCHADTAVELYSLDGEGHEWPGGPKIPAIITAVLGPQSNAVDANSTMWAFFQAHPLP